MTDLNCHAASASGDLVLPQLLAMQMQLTQNLADRYQQLYAYAQSLETALEQQTQQVQEERQLRQQAEERFDRTFHSSPNPSAIVLFEEGRFLEVNESFCQTFGYDRSEVVSKTALELHIWVDLQQRHHMQQHLQTQGTVHNLECSARTKSGEIKTLLLSAEQIELDGELCLLSVANDITTRKQAEAALWETQQRLQGFLSNSPAPMFIVDAQNRLLLHNQSYEKLVARTAAELNGKTMHDIWDVDTADQFVLNNQRLLCNGQSCEHEEVFCLNGQCRTYVTTLFPLYDVQGVAYAIGGICTDITERKRIDDDRKRTEAALRASEQRFRTLIQELHVGVMIQGPRSEILLSNHLAQELLGLSETELLDKSSLSSNWQVVHEDGTPFPGQEHPVPQAIATRQPVRNVVMGVTRSAGEQVWLLVNAEPQLGPDGAVQQVICTFSDITDRKRIEEKLRYNEHLLSQTQKIAQVGGWEINVETSEVTWTEQTYRLHELPIAPLPPSQELINFYTPEYIPIIRQAMQTAVTEGKAFDLEAQLITARGNQVWVRVIGQPDHHNGKVIRVSGSFQNISDRKQAESMLRQAKEAADAANRAKTDFLANMSHELRTPLTSIIGLSEVLNEGAFGKLNDRQQKYATIICQSGKHLLDLINELLDLAKIEAGKMELQFAPTALQELCESSLSFVRQEAQQKQITLTLHIPHPLEVVLLDERRIRQVLINLLSNAVKFTPSGGQVCLQVQFDLPNEILQISVSDTGIGIAPGDMGKLFQPFVQLDSSHSRRYAGTGLGLTLVQRLVDLHNGSLTLHSEVDRGSCFTVSLPLNLAPPPAAPLCFPSLASSLSSSNLPSRLRCPLILLVEDNEANLETFKGYLQLHGYQVVLAHNGQEAVQMTQQHQPDLVFMDIQMPEMNGIEATRQIRAEGHTMPILALTSLMMPGDRSQCFAVGVDEFLTKPISLRNLIQVIEQHLQRNSSELPEA